MYRACKAMCDAAAEQQKSEKNRKKNDCDGSYVAAVPFVYMVNMRSDDVCCGTSAQQQTADGRKGSSSQ